MVHHQKTGYVSDLEPRIIAQNINEYFQEDKMKAFQKNMREEKHKYSWPSFTEEVLNFFDTIKKESLDIFTLQLGIKILNRSE